MASDLKRDELNARSCEIHYQALRDNLTPKQLLALDGVLEGKSMRAAALDAGYANSQCFMQGTALRDCLEMAGQLRQLRSGVTKVAMRGKLLKLFDTASDAEGEGYSAGAAVAAAKLLCQMDGLIEPDGAGGGRVLVVNTGVPAPLPDSTQPPAIDGETVEDTE